MRTIGFYTFLKHKSYLDRLAGVPAIFAFRAAIRKNRERGKQYQIIVVAMDSLDRINYALGAERGDAVLETVFRFLSGISVKIRVFPVEGDRFVLIVKDEMLYEKAMEEIGYFFAGPVLIGDFELNLSACVCGIRNAEECGGENETVAFINYTLDKRRRHGTGTVFETDVKTMSEFLRFREIEHYLYTALEEELFEVWYQPIYSVKRDCFSGVEVLSRLSHPVFGAIPPAEFIPAAERQGQIGEIRRLQMKKVCTFLRKYWELLAVLDNVKLNLSPIELLDENLSKELLREICSNGLPPSLFHFEITETAATLYQENLSDSIRELKEAGCTLCLDDFGAGYANLDIVTKLPFDIVKMDRSMLLEAKRSPEGTILYKNIVRMLKELGFMIIAEGAETQDQVELLREWKVDYIQGFYFSRPVDEQQLLALMKKKATEIESDQTAASLLFKIDELEGTIKAGLDTELFTSYRFVDLNTMEVLPHPSAEAGSYPKCFEIWNRSCPCENCISKKLKKVTDKIVKIEWLDGRALFVLSLKYPFPGRDCALELVYDVSARFADNSFFYHSMHPDRS